MKHFILEHPITAALSIVCFLVVTAGCVFTYMAWALLSELRKDRE